MVGGYIRRQGFTIVELLIVVVIIGVLAGIIVIAYGAVQNNAHNSIVKDDLKKIADVIQLKTLDDEVIPNGGATSSLSGDSTILPGVNVKPNTGSYDLTVNNLFYCAGMINGTKEFGLFAKSKPGKIFYYRSDQGIRELSGSPTLSYSVCQTIGFEAPFTWSYGYNPGEQYKWFAWANKGAEVITNYATNPGYEVNGGWNSNNGAVYPTAIETSIKRTGARSVSSSNVNVATTLMSIYGAGALDGNGMPITESGEYTVSVYVRADVAAQANVGASSRVGGAFPASTYGTLINTISGQWVRVSHTFTVPSGADRVRVIVRVIANVAQPAGTKAYADDLMLTKGSNQWPYRDGSFVSAGWTWSGTANNTTSSGPGVVVE